MTARGAATPPTRCSTSSTGASPTPSSTSALSDTTPTWSCGSPTRPARSDDPDSTHLDAHLLLRPGLPHPDLSDVVGDDPEQGLSLVGADGEQDLRVPGRLPAATALELEERIWEHMHFASHLRSERLGEFTLGTDLNRSDSLAIVQLLVLYHLVTARAKVAAGGAEAATRT